MTKHDREYYSLIEAADIPHGVSDGWPSREKFIKDLIHGAANGKLRFIALTSGIKGRLRTICDGATTEPFQTIEHKYCFIHEDHISVFEQNCHRLVIGKRSQRRISDNNLPRLYGVCLELPSVLNPSGDPNTYLEFDEPIYLYIDTLFILNCDLKAYLAQKELTENISIEGYPKDLQPIIPAIKSKEKDLSTTERETMLKLIIGMATDAYGYDPTNPRNNATGGNKFGISSKLALKGISISDDTIRKYLTEAKNLLPLKASNGATVNRTE